MVDWTKYNAPPDKGNPIRVGGDRRTGKAVPSGRGATKPNPIKDWGRKPMTKRPIKPT